MIKPFQSPLIYQWHGVCNEQERVGLVSSASSRAGVTNRSGGRGRLSTIELPAAPVDLVRITKLVHIGPRH